jgi:hypothetical protein
MGCWFRLLLDSTQAQIGCTGEGIAFACSGHLHASVKLWPVIAVLAKRVGSKVCVVLPTSTKYGTELLVTGRLATRRKGGRGCELRIAVELVGLSRRVTGRRQGTKYGVRLQI